ncbi:MAG: DeoR/GlpR family DNA-binding transcription regulator [Amphritea sp.]|nr:DeoR/GlpR family DNA-binding transcription regulator [Amphritea sp.]
MALSDRQQEILDWLKQSGELLSSNQITEAYAVSPQTIRKDLNELSKRGLVQRVHGGITLPARSSNLSFANRQVINLRAKQAIAREVVKLLPEGCSIFLGIGTTPEQIAHALSEHPGLRVITNNINAALATCQNPNIETMIAGGRIRPSDQDIMGEDTTRYLRRFRVNFGIFGIGGLSARGELLDFSPEESYLSQAIIECSDQRILVADCSKYLRQAPVFTAGLSQIDQLFIDSPHPQIQELCDQAGIELNATMEAASND